MSDRYWAFASRNSISDNVRVWEVTPTGFGGPVTFTGHEAAANALTVSRDSTRFATGHTTSAWIRVWSFDRETGDIGAGFNLSNPPNANIWYLSWSLDNDLFAVAFGRSATGDFVDKTIALYRDNDDGTFTLLDTYDTGEASPTLASISPNGRWVLVSHTNTGTVQVLEVVNDALIARGTVSVSNNNNLARAEWLIDSKRVLVSGQHGLATFMRVVEVNDAGDPTNITDRAITDASGGSGAWSHDGTQATLGAAGTGFGKVFDFDGSTLTEVFNFTETTIRHLRFADSSGLLVSAADSSVGLYSWDGESATQIEGESWASTITGLEVTITLSGLPPTPEEIFRATFADASGRDPYVSALLNAGDAQRMINHAVSLWAGKPGEWKGTPFLCRVPVDYIRYGELHEATVGNVVEVKVNQPGFENGKRLLVLDIDSELRPGPADMICMGWNSDA